MCFPNPRCWTTAISKKLITHHISATIWPILTIYTSYYVFLCKDVLFRGCIDIAPYLGGKMSPKSHFGGQDTLKTNAQCSLSKPLQRFQPNLHYDRDLQILSVGRPKMHSTNPNGGWLPSWKKINHCISATVWPILTIYTSYDVFLCKDLSFVGHVNIAPYFGVKLTCLMIFKTADISHIGLQKKNWIFNGRYGLQSHSASWCQLSRQLFKLLMR